MAFLRKELILDTLSIATEPVYQMRKSGDHDQTENIVRPVSAITRCAKRDLWYQDKLNHWWNATGL
ncbi:MAG: hypothetical protein ABJH45_10805 [Paracoccaceae bacterium]